MIPGGNPPDTVPSWSPPPGEPRITVDEVHVWLAALDLPPPELRRLATTLSEKERERAGRFHSPAHRDRFTAARGVLRDVLGRYTGRDPSEIEFVYGRRGKPMLSGQEEPSIRFNLSHTADLGVVAIARDREIGVDLEHLRAIGRRDAIVQRFFSKEEHRAFHELPACDREEAFFNCWTRKEAIVKAIGEGLSMPLDCFDVTLAPGVPARLLAMRGGDSDDRRWTLRELPLQLGLAGAVAAEGEDWRMTCWRWSSRMVGG